jgi:hypothetical protein
MPDILTPRHTKAELSDYREALLNWRTENAPNAIRRNELLVILALAVCANETGLARPGSAEALAAKARLSERGTRHILRRLERSGEIKIRPSNKGRGNCNLYQLIPKKKGPTK